MYVYKMAHYPGQSEFNDHN